MRIRRNIIFDGSVLLAGAVLFFANDYGIKPLLAGGLFSDSWVELVVFGHLNDVIAGMAFGAFINLLFDAIHPQVRMARLPIIVGALFLCGLFWEFAAPLFIPSTSDWLDVVAYMAGGAIYWALMRLFHTQGKGTVPPQ